jgi:cephalosporin-C deacetylase-like acetyl esterase
MNRSTIFRYRDEVQARFGVPVAEMVNRHYQNLGAKLFAARERERRRIRSLAAWERERQRIRQHFINAIGGPLPRGRTTVKEVGEIRKKSVVLQRLLFAPFPEHWVSANLFLPRHRPAPFPAIVLPQGHSQAGKAPYAPTAVFFAQHGYAVLTFDFVGAGERQLQGARGDLAACTSSQHCLFGSQIVPDGYNLQWFMLAETLAAVDLLCRHPQIDSQRIGITGGSGGGTETAFAAALDERLKVAVPAASVHSFRNELHADDAEQVFFDPIRQGLDYPDLVAFLIAPRPLLVIANTRDIWDIGGTRYAVREARRFYRLHRAADRLRLRVWNRGHAYGWDQLKTALRWFNRWLGNEVEIDARQPAGTANVPSENECRCTRSGNLYREDFRPPIKVFDRKIAAQPRRRPNGEALANLLADVRGRRRRKVPWEEVAAYSAGPFDGRRILFEPEKDLLLPCEIISPPQARGVALLLDENHRLDSLAWQIAVAGEGYIALRPDLRGWGETAPAEKWPDWETWAHNIYSGRRWTLWALMQLAGRNAPVERARDVIALLDVADAMRLPGRRVVYGRRGGAVVGLLAAAADWRIQEARLDGMLSSFAALRETENAVHWPDGLIYGILKAGIDIPDICRAVRPRKVVVTHPLDGLMRPRI